MSNVTLYTTSHGESWPIREIRAGDRTLTVTDEGLQVLERTYRKTVTREDSGTVTADLLAHAARTGDPAVLNFENGVIEIHPTARLPILGLTFDPR